MSELLGYNDDAMDVDFRHERSSDQQAAHTFLKLKLDGMTDQKPDEKGSFVHVLPLGLQVRPPVSAISKCH